MFASPGVRVSPFDDYILFMISTRKYYTLGKTSASLGMWVHNSTQVSTHCCPSQWYRVIGASMLLTIMSRIAYLQSQILPISYQYH